MALGPVNVGNRARAKAKVHDGRKNSWSTQYYLTVEPQARNNKLGPVEADERLVDGPQAKEVSI